MKRFLVAAAAGVFATLACSQPALARGLEQLTTRQDVSGLCNPPPAVGAYCSATVTVTVKTAGTLKMSYFNPRSSDSVPPSNAPLPYDDKVLEFTVDGGATWTGGVTVLAPSSSPQIGPDKVAPGTHTITMRVRWVRDGGGRSSFFGTLSVTTSEPRVSRLDLSFRERTDAAKRTEQATAQRIARAKDVLERQLDAARERGQDLLGRHGTLQARQITATQRYRAIRRVLAQLRQLERQLEADYGAAAAHAGARVAAVQARIVSATRAGTATAALRRTLTQERRTTLAIEQSMVARGPAAMRAERQRWLRSSRELGEEMFELDVAFAETERERERTATTIVRLIAERSNLDRQAVEAALRLGLLDFDVREVTVTADGAVVYRAAGSRSDYERLKLLNEQLALARQAQTGLRPNFDEVREAFYAAQREVIAAEARLANRLWWLAHARYVTDVGFIALDIGMAFAQGGLLGAVNEGVKKAVEITIVNNVSATVFPRGIQPGSIEDEINQQFGAGLGDAFSGAQIAKTGARRALDELVAKPLQANVNRLLVEKLFDPTGARLAVAPWASAAPGLFTTARWRNLTRLPTTFARYSEQIEKLKKGRRFGPRGVELGGLAKSMLKDALKTGISKLYDDLEREVWVTFFEKEIAARTYYATYKLVKDYYFTVEEGIAAIEAARLALVDTGVQEETGFRLLESKRFDPVARLEIRVKAATARRPEELDLAIAIGGVTVTPTARRAAGAGEVELVYAAEARALDSGTDGLLTLVVR